MSLFQTFNQFENRERYSSRTYLDERRKHIDDNTDEQINKVSKNNEFKYYDHEDYWDDYIPSDQRSDYSEVDYSQHDLTFANILIEFEASGER